MSSRATVATLLIGLLVGGSALAQKRGSSTRVQRKFTQKKSGAKRTRTKAKQVKVEKRRKRDAQQLITAAYKLSKTAKTIPAYTEVIELCQELLQPTTAKATKADRDYAKQLMAWSLNRRGEKRAIKAKGLHAGGKKFAGDKMDELALSDFHAAIKADPKRWKAIHNRGVSLALVGKFSAAVKDFTAVLRIKPKYTNAWFNRAEIRYEMGQFEAAIADYGHALKLDSKDVGAYLSRGHAYFRVRKYQSALDDYDQAVRLAPGNIDAVLNRADAFHKLQIWQRAAKDFRRAIFLNDRSARAYQNSAWLMATCPDARFRNAGLAVKAAKRAVALQGQKPSYESLDALAAAYASDSQFKKAQETIKRAIKLAPKKEQRLLRQREKMYLAETPYIQPIRVAARKGPKRR